MPGTGGFIGKARLEGGAGHGAVIFPAAGHHRTLSEHPADGNRKLNISSNRAQRDKPFPKFKNPVDEYLQQIYHGLIDAPYLDKVLDVIDPKTIMWGSDFPHARCTYPNTMAVVDRVFGNLDERTRRDITCDNCARFYNFDVADA